MNRDKFRQLVEHYLLPLFSGARLDNGLGKSTKRQPTVSWRDPCALNAKPAKEDDYCVVMIRSQPFAKLGSQSVTEHGVVRAFVSVLAEFAPGIGKDCEQDLLSNLVRRIVARSVCADRKHERTVLAAIDQLDLWSTRLYEGQPITAAVGFVPDSVTTGLPLLETWKQEFCPLLTNGFDTLLVASFDGHIQRYEELSVPANLPSYAPHRLSPIAEWTGDGRIALVLNRIGEILVIRNRELVFARRGGRWHFLTHEPVITQMKCPHNQTVRRAVYASCLDASFARTGACVGIMTSGDVSKLSTVAPKIEDHIQKQSSPKARLIHRITSGKRFQDLDRRLRQELLAIDGATIIDYRGTVLAVGAILHIAGGSSGGGRLAAAVELSKCGTGIKVSQDGGIKGFYRCRTPSDPKPDFFVM
jgi:hypothetical protein